MAPPMTPPTNQIDEKLDEWGSRLFNVSTETLPRPRGSKRNSLDSAKPVSTGGRLSTPQARATYVRQKLQAMVRRAPQVVVKLVKAPKGMKGISNNLTYVSRDGQLEIEDQDGQVIHGKDAVHALFRATVSRSCLRVVTPLPAVSFAIPPLRPRRCAHALLVSIASSSWSVVSMPRTSASA